MQRLLWLWRQVQTGGHENRIGTRCGLVNFALDGRQKRTRSLFGPLLETSFKHTSRAWLSRSELQANQLARAFLTCRSGSHGIKPNQRVSISPSRTRYQDALLRAVSALSTGGASSARRVPLLSKRVTVKGGLSANRKDSCFGRSIQR